MATTQLGPNIFLLPPLREKHLESAARDASSDEPSVIILCTWLGGATARRVAKYSTGYRDLYQGATILVIRTVMMDLTVRSFDALRACLAPARKAIASLLSAGPQKTGTGLLHMFSHGGCNTALQLLASMSAPERSSLQDCLRLVVFDCCPGDTSFTRAYEAGLLSLPTQMPLRSTLGAAAVCGFVSVIQALQRTGLMRSVEDMRQELNAPWAFGPAARRLYLFSEGDRAVAPQDVLSHAKQGEMLGFRVMTARFRDAPHCSLLVEDAVRYWGVIRRHWIEHQHVAPSLKTEMPTMSPKL